MAPMAVAVAPPEAGSPVTSKDYLPAGLKLIAPDTLDLRSDEEITLWLQTRHPVTSDKNVWAFWHTGFAKMAPWVQRSIINWVRRLGPDWTVHVLDAVDGSETNVYNYVDVHYFPDAFNNKTMDGPSVGPHSGDLVRLPLLWLYGGVWMDAGIFLFRHLEDICWRQIEDPDTPYEIGGLVIEIRPNVDAMLNGFIACKRNNPFIKRWHEIYVALWEGKTNAKGFHSHQLLKHLPLLSPPGDKLGTPDLGSLMEGFSDYLAHFLCFERLRKLIDPNDGFNGPEYYANKMFLMPAMQEMWYFQQITGWSGRRQFDLLTANRTGDEAVRDEKWHAAETFVNDALANTSMLKLSHGPPGGLGDLNVFLADMWDSKEHEEKDNVKGTFAEYLRYGSVRFDQTREIRPLKLEPTTEEVLKVGYLEASKSN